MTGGIDGEGRDCRPIRPGRPGDRGDVAGELPPVRVEPDARRRIRRALVEAGRRIAVLDDDPTGSQTVHDVDVVTVFEPDEIAAGLSSASSTCFFLTNTQPVRGRRGGAEHPDRTDALRPGHPPGRTDRRGQPQRLDTARSRHRRAALDAVRRQATGRGFDGVLMVPAYFEAGRFTAGNVHWARVGADVLPASETEFARDATFGYAASDLRDFVAEKSGGAVQPGDVLSITHDDIRLGGPRRVAELLAGVTDGRFVVVNAVEYADLDVVVLGLLEAAAAGRSFLPAAGRRSCRPWPGWTRRDPLQASDIWPAGHPGGHGLVVVGSHVGLTSRQVAVARRWQVDRSRARRRSHRRPGRRDATWPSHPAGRLGLDRSEVLLLPAVMLLRGRDATESLEISRRVSTAVTEVVGAAAALGRLGRGQGRITSHDVAVHGLGIRRARSSASCSWRMVSVFRPIDAAPEVVGTPYVVFAGNVGDETTLASVVDLFGGEPGGPLPAN